MLRTFYRDRRGAIMPIFAIALIPLVVATGGLVDYSRAFHQSTVVQDAMDSAALAAGKKIGVVSTTLVKAEADNFYTANIASKVEVIPKLYSAVSTSTITLTTQFHVPTYFLGMIGLNEFVFNLVSQATQAMGTLEVVMALDNSGSMAGSKIVTLRSAAADLTTTLFNLGPTSGLPDPVKVGVVPFASAVNVGPGYFTNTWATWLDKAGIGTYNLDAMDGTAKVSNPFTFLSYMTSATWLGCVEERPIPYDATDDEASTAFSDTMFVPMFAPDEPDTLTCTGGTCTTSGSGSTRAYSGAPDGNYSYNNYLPDNGYIGGTNFGACSTTADKKLTGGNQATESTAFSRTCKYGSTTKHPSPADLTIGGIPGGPNFMCTTPALTPLTISKSTVTTAIGNLVSTGATNIQSGLMWGWRLLSPTEPFTEGRPYSAANNKKILILMTDGENTYYPNSALLKSWYGDWGFASRDHLETGSNAASSSTITTAMNARTLQACSNAKIAGIKIFTVGFEINSGTASNPSAALALLQGCATDADSYFDAQDETALTAAFTAIGERITLLRISQ